jgi:hypothetical protein
VSIYEPLDSGLCRKDDIQSNLPGIEPNKMSKMSSSFDSVLPPCIEPRLEVSHVQIPTGKN